MVLSAPRCSSRQACGQWSCVQAWALTNFDRRRGARCATVFEGNARY
jgi:hypothetical protein